MRKMSYDEQTITRPSPTGRQALGYVMINNMARTIEQITTRLSEPSEERAPNAPASDDPNLSLEVV